MVVWGTLWKVEEWGYARKVTPSLPTPIHPSLLVCIWPWRRSSCLTDCWPTVAELLLGLHCSLDNCSLVSGEKHTHNHYYEWYTFNLGTQNHNWPATNFCCLCWMIMKLQKLFWKHFLGTRVIKYTLRGVTAFNVGPTCCYKVFHKTVTVYHERLIYC